MQETVYPLFAERMQTGRLANGLLVNMIARPNFHKTYAILTVDFGSIDDTFTTEQGEKITVPAGIAHFLEHKKRIMTRLIFSESTALMPMPLLVIRGQVIYLLLQVTWTNV